MEETFEINANEALAAKFAWWQYSRPIRVFYALVGSVSMLALAAANFLGERKAGDGDAFVAVFVLGLGLMALVPAVAAACVHARFNRTEKPFVMTLAQHRDSLILRYPNEGIAYEVAWSRISLLAKTSRYIFFGFAGGRCLIDRRKASDAFVTSFLCAVSGRGTLPPELPKGERFVQKDAANHD